MLWYTHRSRIGLGNYDKGAKLVVLSNTPSQVMDMLLVRPSEKQAYWSSTPDRLDLSRMSSLNVVGVLYDTFVPSRGPTGYWGFTLGAPNSDDVLSTISKAEQQINTQADVANFFVNNSAGTLLWLSSYGASGVDSELCSCWTIAPSKDFLPTDAASWSFEADQTYITFDDAQFRAHESQGLGMYRATEAALATDHDAATVRVSMATTVDAYPYVAPNV